VTTERVVLFLALAALVGAAWLAATSPPAPEVPAPEEPTDWALAITGLRAEMYGHLAAIAQALREAGIAGYDRALGGRLRAGEIFLENP